MKLALSKTILSTAAGAALTLAATTGTALAANGDTLKAVQERGSLLCSGHNGSFPPFVQVTDDNKWSGYDIDYCRALAVATLGSDENLKVVPISWAQRFPSLQSGDIDVVIKATGWTMGRDTELGIQFSVPYFVGATNVMMPKELGSTDPETLSGGSLCANAGTSTELDLSILNCPGEGAPFVIGSFVVVDSGGSLCLAPSAGTGALSATDCDELIPSDPVQVTGFSSSGPPAEQVQP